MRNLGELHIITNKIYFSMISNKNNRERKYSDSSNDEYTKTLFEKIMNLTRVTQAYTLLP